MQPGRGGPSSASPPVSGSGRLGIIHGKDHSPHLLLLDREFIESVAGGRGCGGASNAKKKNGIQPSEELSVL